MWISKKEYLELHETLKQVQNDFSVLKEIFTRLVEQERTISFDVVDEIPDGLIRWDTVQTEVGSKQMTVWYEINERSESEKVSA
jgi:hypothetical protein